MDNREYFDNNEDNKFDFNDYLDRLTRSWPIFLISGVICLSLAWLFIRFSDFQFHINAKILIEDDKGTNSGISTGGIDLMNIMGAKSSVDNEAEVLSTRYLMEKLVSDLNLNFVWYGTTAVKDIELAEPPFELKVLSLNDSIQSTSFLITAINDSAFHLAYKQKNKNGRADVSRNIAFNKKFSIPDFGEFVLFQNGKSILGNEYALMISSIDARVAALKNSLNVSVTNKSASTISLMFDYPLPAKGEYILQSYINEYIKQNIQSKSRIADSTIAFIDERILLVNAELNGIEGNIQQFMQGSGLANISEQSRLLLSNSSDFLKQLAEIVARIEVIDGVTELLNQKDMATRLVSGSLLSTDPGFNDLISRYNNLNLEREKLLLSYTKDNPYVVNIDGQIDVIRFDILEYLKNTRRSLEINKKEIERNSGRLEGNIRQVPAQERVYLDLARQQQLKQDLYLFLLQKREETAVAKTSNIAGIRVIDPPKSDFGPFSPKKPLVYAIALLITIIIPVGRLYAQDLLNTKIRDRKDIEKRTNIPIVAELSHNTTDKDLIQFDRSRSSLAEQFRALRSNMRFLMPGYANKVILITSGMPGEGKSFTSLNLANVYAALGKKVLLLEFDLRKPKIYTAFGELGGVGISNYLVDSSIRLAEVAKPVDRTETLFVGVCGPIPPNPSELILSERTEQLLAEAREMFDVIIVDAPPIGVVIDAQLLTPFCDLSLYIVRANYTPHTLLRLPEDVKNSGKIKNLAIILNDIKENSKGYYGYHYGYYNEEEVKRSWWKRKF